MAYAVHYYDLVLIAIGLSLMTGVGVAAVTPVGLATASTVFSVLAIIVIGHALFVNGPVDELGELTDEVEPQEVPVLATTAKLVGDPNQ